MNYPLIINLYSGVMQGRWGGGLLSIREGGVGKMRLQEMLCLSCDCDTLQPLMTSQQYYYYFQHCTCV